MSSNPSKFFTNAAKLSRAEIREELELVKPLLDWYNTDGRARRWWQAFENENEERLGLVLRTAEELLYRQTTILEFFWAYTYSGTDNIQTNLDFLDFVRTRLPERKLRPDDFKHIVQ